MLAQQTFEHQYPHDPVGSDNLSPWILMLSVPLLLGIVLGLLIGNLKRRS